MSFRHSLIHWLAHGDFIMLNGERRDNGFWVPKELGGVAIINCDFETGDDPYAIELVEAIRLSGLELTRTHLLSNRAQRLTG